MKKAAKTSTRVTAGKKSDQKPRPAKPTRFAGLKANPNKPDSSRRERQAKRLAQLLQILERIQGRGRWDVTELAHDIGCSERTVYRHLDALKAYGVGLEYDPVRECYKLHTSFQFPAINVTEEEALGQATASAITKATGLDIGSGAGPVSQKLAVKSEDNIAQILDDGDKLFTVMGLQLANHRMHREIIRTAQWALLKHRKLIGTYKSPYQPQPRRLELSPYRICLIKQSWYLIAKPSDSDLPHTYRLARFQSLKMTNTFAPMDDEFDIKRYFGDAWAVYRGDTKYAVEILFTPDAGDLVTETEWHHSQKATRHKDGSVTLSFQVDGLNEIVHWVLGWSNRAKVLQPPELQLKVRDYLKQALGLYGN